MSTARTAADAKKPISTSVNDGWNSTICAFGIPRSSRISLTEVAEPSTRPAAIASSVVNELALSGFTMSAARSGSRRQRATLSPSATYLPWAVAVERITVVQ